MPLVSEYQPPALEWGWTSTAPNIIPGDSIAPPPGVRVALLPTRADIPNSTYKKIGVSHIYRNNGQPDPDTDFSDTAIFDNCASVYGACGGGHPNNWTYQSVVNAANAIQSPTQAQVIAEEVGEYINIQAGQAGVYVPINQWNQSAAGGWFLDRMATRCQAAGSTFYGGYDGIIDIGTLVSGGNMQPIRDGLNSNSGASTVAQNYTGFANRYFANGAGATRTIYDDQGNAVATNITMGGIIKAYQTGEDLRERWVFKHLAHMKLARMAQVHRGYTGRLCFVFWPGFDERPGSMPYNGQPWRRQTPAGGTVTGNTVPWWGFDAQIFLHACVMLEGYDIFCWEIAMRQGSNPNVAPLASTNEIILSGNVGQQAGPAYAYTTANVQFPVFPLGGYDITFAAMHLTTYMRAHAAGPLQYAKVAVNGGSFPVGAIPTDYLVDRFTGNKIFAFYMSQGGNRSLLVWDGNDPGTERTVSVDLNGTTHSFNSFGQFYYAARLTV